MKEIIIILLLILIPYISMGEVYKWVDDEGAVHFTDDPTKIPQKYLPKSEKISIREEKIEIKHKTDERIPIKKGNAIKDSLGRGEEYWRNRVEEWRNKFKNAQERFDTLKLKYNELTERINESKSSVERSNIRRERDKIKNEIDWYKAQMEEAKIILEKKIPEEAELYRAKPEWIK